MTNILFAISLGLTLGSSSVGLVAYARSWAYLDEGSTGGHLSLPSEKWQFIIISFLKCTLAPLLYQAFFEIGCAIATPHGSEDGVIPVSTMLKVLERKLIDGATLVKDPPSWEAPAYKIQDYHVTQQ